MSAPADPRIVLVSGIPASGKTTFAEWLAQRGFLHLDVEKTPWPPGSEQLKVAWDEIQRVGGISGFVSALRATGRSIVIDWGFPMHCIPLVEELLRAGIDGWWFDGDRDASRASFVRRGTVRLEAYEIQMEAIRREWPTIQNLFSDRIVFTVDRGPSYKSMHEIAAAIGLQAR